MSLTEEAPVTIGGAYVQYSDVFMPQRSKRFYKHQKEMIEAEADVIVLDAPTGSGKTMAALARVCKKRSPAIFVYPTNALIRDQVNKIKDLAADLGLSPCVISGKTRDTPSGNPNELIIIHLTADSLDQMSHQTSPSASAIEDVLSGSLKASPERPTHERTSKGRKIDRVLSETEGKGSLRIILTNPDMLYLAFAGWYHHHGRISEELAKFATLVIDEFHLYAGPSLARLVFMLNEIRGPPEKPRVNLVFLSATHGDSMGLLQQTYPHLRVVSGVPLDVPEGDCTPIRHETTVSVIAQDTVMTDDSSAENVTQRIVEYYRKPSLTESRNPDSMVKVLGIFSSVTFAMRVARRVTETIRGSGIDPDGVVLQLHGLIPHEARPDISRLKKEAILIGTSAIEVGVDFDVPFLVMEAHDLSSFLQRFGRGGRHNKCMVTLYVPLSMTLSLRGVQSIPFSQLLKRAGEAFREMPSYSEFVCSRHALRILHAMALAASRKPMSIRKKTVTFDYDIAAEYFRSVLAECNKNVQFNGSKLIDSSTTAATDDIRMRLEEFDVEVLARHSLLRGTMNSVPVVVPGSLLEMPIAKSCGEMDILDLAKVKGHLESFREHSSSMPRSIRERYDDEDLVFVVDSLERGEYPTLAFTGHGHYIRSASVFFSKYVSVKVSNLKMREVIEKLMDRRNLIFHWMSMTKNTDYRIPRIYVDGASGAAVIGDWALVAEFLSEKQKEESRH